MNIYARYFDQDILVHNYEDLISFLSSIPEIPLTKDLAADIQTYMTSDMPYPKRYKIRPRVYFILIKTSAKTMEEFKAHRKSAEEVPARKNFVHPVPGNLQVSKKEWRNAQLTEQRSGWYLGRMTFKRMVQLDESGKCGYQDTAFEAFVRAESGADCYNRIVDHLRGRSEVDQRSQFPSSRGANFSFEFFGEELPEGVAV